MIEGFAVIARSRRRRGNPERHTARFAALDCFAALAMTVIMTGCTDAPEAIQSETEVTGTERQEVVNESAVSSEDESECNRAKEAAVAARLTYDRDYAERNGRPVPSQASLSVDQLDACRLVNGGAFVGKFGGIQWRFVPVVDGRYVTDPRQIWKTDTSSGSDGIWYSEWRGDFASDSRAAELSELLEQSREVE